MNITLHTLKCNVNYWRYCYKDVCERESVCAAVWSHNDAWLAGFTTLLGRGTPSRNQVWCQSTTGCFHEHGRKVAPWFRDDMGLERLNQASLRHMQIPYKADQPKCQPITLNSMGLEQFIESLRGCRHVVAERGWRDDTGWHCIVAMCGGGRMRKKQAHHCWLP